MCKNDANNSKRIADSNLDSFQHTYQDSDRDCDSNQHAKRYSDRDLDSIQHASQDANWNSKTNFVCDLRHKNVE